MHILTLGKHNPQNGKYKEKQDHSSFYFDLFVILKTDHNLGGQPRVTLCN
jgi:hypothetical protein